MLNDLEEILKEEQDEYTDEEIRMIQERARKRADELMTKLLELASIYMIDPEAENESETSALYMATFMDRYFELIHNTAPNQKLQEKADSAMKIMFQ